MESRITRRHRERMERIRALVVEAVERGEPAPTNVELACQLDIASAGTTAELVRKLEREGAFKVRRYSGDRVITLPDGRSTRRRFTYENTHFREARAR